MTPLGIPYSSLDATVAAAELKSARAFLGDGSAGVQFLCLWSVGVCIIGRINLLVVLSDIHTDMTIYINDRGLLALGVFFKLDLGLVDNRTKKAGEKVRII